MCVLLTSARARSESFVLYDQGRLIAHVDMVIAARLLPLSKKCV